MTVTEPDATVTANGLAARANLFEVNPGGATTFQVSTNLPPGVAYQWRFSGTDIQGATQPTYTVTNTSFANLGVYSVQVALAGFSTEVRDGITVQVDAVVRVDFALKVGNTAEKIEVMADAPLLQRPTRSRWC